MSDSFTDFSNASHSAAELPRLLDVLPANAGLSLADKRTLVDQASVLIEQVYAHLHLKEALYGINPVQRLTLLQYRLEDPQDDVVQSELEFHRELLSIIHSMHDLHTNYVLPTPYRRLTAVLPFLVEEFFDDEENPHYIVTKLTKDYSHAHFKLGVEVVLWNGLPIEEAIRRNGEQESGSNAAARFAVGLRSLTIRTLAISLPPEEVSIRITYRDKNGKERESDFEWLTLGAPPITTADEGAAISFNRSASPATHSAEPDEATDLYLESLMGYHLQATQINACRKHLYANAGEAPATQPSLAEPLTSNMPDIIKAATLTTPDGEFAYLRLFSFSVQDNNAYLTEIIRLLKALPQNGLVLDLRGNPGGLITAAETLLQLLTPHTIQPEKAQFKSSPLVRELCRRNSPSRMIPALNLQPWVDSLSRAHASGALYSTGHGITSDHDANAIGQVYTAPVVLITDAYCYSAADMFAAGFRDHHIGQILGASDNTGAGGANVWRHLLLKILSESPGIDESGLLKGVFKELPRSADFRVSSRRMLRVGEAAGMPLEDFGVEPDERHYMTQKDVLNGNVDLYNHATRILTKQTRHQMDVEVDAQHCELKISTQNIERIDWFIDDRATGSLDVKHNEAVINLGSSDQKRQVTLFAYKGGNKVAASKQHIVCGA
ncbi:MAG: Peptidase S41 [uncultured Thiotrichaceae bacterium]|uniref:Peptidase S41 n=1 Tax=uncultured Thiotrichaceae bacterium TaxID=298394 RepID=A0A6S6TNQ5_9GAMM|nr:MAG: Peptidase S41 [uncultured Thiotrichaceae bacterium]